MMGIRWDVAKMRVGIAAKGKGPSGRAFLQGPEGLAVVTLNALSRISRGAQSPQRVRARKQRVRVNHPIADPPPVTSTALSVDDALMVDPWGLTLHQGYRLHPPASGVYFVFLSGELIYIGQSRNVRSRLKQHEVVTVVSRMHPGQVDTASIPVALDDLDTVEYSLIKAFTPKLNRMMAPGDNIRAINERKRARASTEGSK